MYCFLGTRRAFNDHPQDDEGNYKPVEDRELIEAKSRVEVIFPAGTSLSEAFTVVTAPTGVWANQSPDDAPVWVASDRPELAALISSHYGIPVREPLPAGERDEHIGRVGHFELAEG